MNVRSVCKSLEKWYSAETHEEEREVRVPSSLSPHASAVLDTKATLYFGIIKIHVISHSSVHRHIRINNIYLVRV